MSRQIVDIVMPMEEGRFIDQAVLEGILSQNIPFRLWVSTKHSDGNYATARNNVKQYASSDLVLMLDNDIILPKSALSQMLAFLSQNLDYAAIGLPKHDPHAQNDSELLNAPHVGMSCVLFRRSILESIVFQHPHFQPIEEEGFVGGCECAKCCWDIRKKGWKIGYLPGLLVTHLEGTKTPISSDSL